MKTLVERIYIIETDENIIKNALNNPGNDFEDSVQYYCAKKCDLDVIITHDADFHKRDIPVMSIQEFFTFYKSNQ